MRPRSRVARPRWRLAVVLSAATAVGASSVADSLHLDPAGIHASAFSPAVPTLCRSALGSYALPKTFLKVIVQRTGEGPPELLAPTTVITADKSLTFCLDHIADPLADDEIRIIKASGQLDESGAAVWGAFSSPHFPSVVSNTPPPPEINAWVRAPNAFNTPFSTTQLTPLGRD